MRSALFPALLAAAFVSAATAQTSVIGIDDLNPTTGTSNLFPWSLTGGATSLHVYSAQTLQSLGICAGSVLTDVEVAPSSGSAGTYNAPQAQMQIGHLAVSPPVPGNWGAHLATPLMIHDLTSGPYTFSWTLNTYAPLPGFSTSPFVWNGTTDIGIQYTSSPGTTGGFSARRTATQLRHYVAIFNATNQLPTSNGLFAMEVRMTWLLNGCATRVTYGAGCDAPVLTLNSNLPTIGTNFTLTTTNVNAVSPVGLVFFGDAQVVPPLDLGFLGAPGCSLHTSANLVSLTFLVAAGSGSLVIPVPADPLLLGSTFTSQSVAFTPNNQLGLAFSNGLLWTVGN
jgi:hypothetical protein